MPIIGYKKKFKNLNGYENDVFTVNFDLEYKTNGFLRIKNVENNYFDNFIMKSFKEGLMHSPHFEHIGDCILTDSLKNGL